MDQHSLPDRAARPTAKELRQDFDEQLLRRADPHAGLPISNETVLKLLNRLRDRLEALERAARTALPCPTCGGNGSVAVITTPLEDVMQARIPFEPLPGEAQLLQCPTCGGAGDLIGDLAALEGQR